MIKTPFSIVLMVVLVVACSEDKPKEVGRSAASETPVETAEVVDNTPIISSTPWALIKDGNISFHSISISVLQIPFL